MSYPPSSTSSYADTPHGPGTGQQDPAQAPYGPGPGGAQYAPGRTPYGPGPYVQAAPSPAPAPKGRKGPLILLLSGVALCVVAGIAIIIVAVSATRTAGELQPIVANGTTTVRLEAGEVYGLYGNGSSGCTVAGADGTELEVTKPSSSITVNDRRLFGVIAPASSGDHAITCSTLLASEDVYFGPLIGAQDIGRAVFGVLAAAGLLVLGVPLTISGIIWLVVRNSHNRRALQAQAAYPTAGTGL